MKDRFKKIANIFSWILGVGGLMFLSGFVSSRHNELPCRSFEVNIDHVYGHLFVEAEDVKLLIADKGIRIEGMSIKDINTGLLEKTVNTNPWVANAEIYLTIDGTAHANIVQRIPILRVVTILNENYYIDDQGGFMPVSEKYTANVPVANGFIYHSYGQKNALLLNDSLRTDTLVKKTPVDEVYTIAAFISRDSLLNALTEQLYVDENFETELILRTGGQRVRIGDASSLAEKFDKLKIFYSEGLSRDEADKYSVIDLRFKDQVVCTKKELTLSK